MSLGELRIPSSCICATSAYDGPENQLLLLESQRLSHADYYSSSTQPHTALRYGGASPVKHDTQSIAGTTAEAKRGNSGMSYHTTMSHPPRD